MWAKMMEFTAMLRRCWAVVLIMMVVLSASETIIHDVNEKPSVLVEVATSAAAAATALLVALQDGPAGRAALSEWNEYAGALGADLPSVFILCQDGDHETLQLVEDAEHVRPFAVAMNSEGHFWSRVLEEVSAHNKQVSLFGLLGEGVVPHPGLAQEIRSVEAVLGEAVHPTAVLSRSQARGNNDDKYSAAEYWLPDAFIAQLWLNRKMPVTDSLLEYASEDLTLLQVLPQLAQGGDLVDGTSVLHSFFAVSEGEPMPVVGNATAADGGDIYISDLELALVLGDDGSVEIGTAPWPPRHVLETVANKDGLVIVNSVNCGYLDFATNFLRSVQRVTDSKVLWVAMDEVAFDFMDALAPGCVAMFPSEGSERHHAIKAGAFGDATFQAEVLVRPGILQSILAQGYTVLWTDSDMIWLKNPLTLLPDIHDPLAAELVLQEDAMEHNKCTCFMFIRPTETAKALLNRWMQSIVDTNANQDQIAFNPALRELQSEDVGLRLEIIPAALFPAGKNFFNHPYVENYVQAYHEGVMIVHNNWIRGHNRKVKRFKEFQFWDVENVYFPGCDGRRRHLTVPQAVTVS